MMGRLRFRLSAVRYSHGVVFAAVLASLFLCVAAPAQDAPLGGDEIRRLIVGNTVIGPIGARLYDFSFEPDGDVYGGIGEGSDSGSWSVSDDGLYCHEWTMYFDGVRRCYRWRRAEKGRYRMVNVDTFRRRNIDVWRIEPGLK